jgi:hypothetical protein
VHMIIFFEYPTVLQFNAVADILEDLYNKNKNEILK